MGYVGSFGEAHLSNFKYRALKLRTSKFGPRRILRRFRAGRLRYSFHGLDAYVPFVI